MRRYLSAVLAVLILAFCAAGCRGRDEAKPGAAGKLRVVTTIFPVYEFARNLAGDRAEVTMLLPPGMEPHSFEPRPEDIVRVHKADLFVYTNPAMEPWAAGIVKGSGAERLTVVDASRGARLLKANGGGHDHGAEKGHHEDEGGIDPHLWLDFANAGVMVENIAAALEAKDPANRDFYRANAAAYGAKLAALDERYRSTFATCAKRTFLHGGHFAFGYLANRYGLQYQSAYAASANAEPTPARLAALVKKIRQEGLTVIYTEELLDPRTAETVARETGARVLMLNGVHTIGRDDLARGATFLSLMEQNLDNLKVGLQCR